MEMGIQELAPDTPGATDAERRLEAWLRLPDRDRAELLDGRIVYKAMPSVEHGDAIIGVVEQLGRLRGPPPRGGGWWLSQEVDMYLAGQGLRPDVVGWRIDRHPRPPRKQNVGSHLGVYVSHPDWICEVLSESTRRRDEVEGAKWRAYHEVGVEWYWTVDLLRDQITVYRRGATTYEAVQVAAGEAIKTLSPFEEVVFEVGRVFLLSRLSREAEREEREER